MGHRNTLVQLFGDSSSAAFPLADAIALAFPDTTPSIEAAPSIGQAAKQPSSVHRRIAVLFHPSDGDLAEATAARDEEQLPLWSILVVAEAFEAASQPVAWAPPGLSAAELAALLRAADRAHHERRRVLQAQGDALSVSTRICHDLCSPLSTVQTAVSLLSTLRDDANASEVTRLAISSLKQQQALIGNLRRFSEAIGNTPERVPINMDTAFQDGLELTRMAMDENGRLAQGPETWPSDALGDQRLVYFMWEMTLHYLATTPRCEGPIQIGWERVEDDACYRFWGRARLVSDWTGDASGIVPFHLLHQFRDNRELGPPFVLRLAQIQGGSAQQRVDEERVLELAFTLPRS